MAPTKIQNNADLLPHILLRPTIMDSFSPLLWILGNALIDANKLMASRGNAKYVMASFQSEINPTTK